MCVMVDLNDVEHEILFVMLNDYVSLGEIVCRVRHLSGSSTLSEVTLRVLQNLMTVSAMPLVVPGELKENGIFVAWDTSAIKNIERIAIAWNQLGSEPCLGDICWFDITREGEEAIRSIMRGQGDGRSTI